uniref:Uncharacterized protein n=1 Tax=Arundo donax TaxID=35708 RepID=A0A0A9HTS7_ARUDO
MPDQIQKSSGEPLSLHLFVIRMNSSACRRL